MVPELTQTQEQPETIPASQSTEQPTAAARVTTPAANTHGQTGTADRPARSPVPASAKAEAKKVGQSGQEAAVELPVDTHSPSPETPEAIADEEAAQANPTSSAPLSNPQAVASDQNADTTSAVKAPEAGNPPSASGAVLSDDDVPAFLRKTIADYRPNCLNPDACGASGLTECYSCRKAAEMEAA